MQFFTASAILLFTTIQYLRLQTLNFSGGYSALNAHSKKREDVLTEYTSNPHHGLTAAQIQSLTEKYGPNKLKEKKKKTTFQRFLDQFKDVMILILIAAAVISFVVICVEQNWGV